jgi:hypothetical protein
MKKSRVTLTALLLVVGAIAISCNTPSEKVAIAKSNVLKANDALDRANEEYVADIERYRQETADKVAANQKSIEEFNARIENDKKEARADYKKKIAGLEQKNTDMKKRMDDYKADGKNNWDKFKTEFNHDMEEIGKSLKDLTVKNVK